MGRFFEFKENEKAMQKDIAVTGKEMLEAAGFKDVEVKAPSLSPGMPTMKWVLPVWVKTLKLLF